MCSTAVPKIFICDQATLTLGTSQTLCNIWPNKSLDIRAHSNVILNWSIPKLYDKAESSLAVSSPIPFMDDMKRVLETISITVLFWTSVIKRWALQGRLLMKLGPFSQERKGLTAMICRCPIYQRTVYQRRKGNSGVLVGKKKWKRSMF